MIRTSELLSNLPLNEASLIRPYLRNVRLVSGQVVVERDHAVEHVFFIEEGVVSLVAEAAGQRAGVQVAMIGKEGLVGGDALLDGHRATGSSAVVLIPGRALRLASNDLRDLRAQCPELQRRCFAAIAALFHQVVETSACNARSTLMERSARWLLMAHQRVDFGDLYITHEALSSVLGVRRSGVSVVLAALQEAQLVTVHRGRIVVRDRDGLGQILAGRIHNGKSLVDADDGNDAPIAIDASAVRRGDGAYAPDTEGRLP